MMKTPLTLLFQNWTVQSEPPSALSAPASSRDVLADLAKVSWMCTLDLLQIADKEK